MQAASALLLACAFLVLSRFYPRRHLRLWAGAWLASAVQTAMAAAAVVLQSPIAMPVSSLVAIWVSQSAGYMHVALLVLGAWHMIVEEDDRPRRWGMALLFAASVALVTTLAVPHDPSSAANAVRISVRVGLLGVLMGAAALASAWLVWRSSVAKRSSLGARWMVMVLVLLGVHRITMALASTLGAGKQLPVMMDLLQAAPLTDTLLLMALGIGTAIAMVEVEQSEMRRAAERQLEVERAARASGAGLISALAAVSDMVTVIDTKGALVAWNPAFDTFVQQSAGAPPSTGQPLRDVMPAGSEQEWDARIAAILSGTDQVFEAAFDASDVAATSFDVSARPIRDGGDVVGGVIVARDVTERRKLEQQLQQAQRLDTVGRLAGGIAHDFNNLLTAILSSASVARECLPPDHEVQADLADVQLAGERATQLTKQLLAFARRQPVSQQPIELNDRVGTMERMLSRLVGPDVALSVGLGDGLWPVRADGPQLEQVLVNVVVNARDAMPEGGRLSIRTGNRRIKEGAIVLPRPMPAGDYVEITVTDTGTGMDEETLAHVFEPFYTTKPVGQGTGLGLAMCYGIIRQHHGVIWIESAVGRGTTVYILLPRYEGEMPARADTAAVTHPTPVTTGTETVLLVEDEPQVRAVAARALRGAGYRVLEATNGRDGVQVARRERDSIALIVSDVVMPEMGGREMVELARQFLPDAAVLFVSGYTAGSFPLPTDDPSANLFLQKPFTPVALLTMVRQVLDRHAELRAARPVAARAD